MFFVTVTCYIYDKTTKYHQTICHLITNKSITSYYFGYSYCKRPQRESIKKFCEFNIKICDSNIIVTCNSYKNVWLYLLQNVIFLKYANFFFFVLTNQMQKSFQKFDFFLNLFEELGSGTGLIRFCLGTILERHYPYKVNFSRKRVNHFRNVSQHSSDGKSRKDVWIIRYC